ncbi:MAG: PqiC family protein [Thermodesulfobacteriota bacterium]|nr:PqiC family protein [Thermodesulfobacteriota bacterium]
MRYLISILLLLCTSCIQIGSDPQPMQYYLLESMPERPTFSSDNTLNINLELVNFPDYLDRLQIVTRNNNSGIEFSDTERWAEPLQDNLTRILRENLALLLPNSRITVSPWENSIEGARKVKLVINKFFGKLGDRTQIEIRWSINNDRGETIQGHFIDRHPIGNSYQDLVVGLNNGINHLSQNLAKELVKQ